MEQSRYHYTKLFENNETTGKMKFIAENYPLRRAAKEKNETRSNFAKKIVETELKLLKI
ncbi:hypothetical protein DPMN_074002 [Dreissena polymorpha]|uniref:Uncharacterized protein n=1 Tax=Dreissena polymorpha TaxID=45954 RepID=A0A9D3YGV2_DREPO|nr:hypothetical protein DPMN_074002 [Dreissena polymorpha]